jgi:hypothetical protein
VTGKKLGDMTPAERHAAIGRVAGRFQEELQQHAAAIGNIMDDAAPEGFYVSVQDGGRTGLLLGPYATRPDAEHDVPAGKQRAEQVNDRACWYAYGVTRVVMQPGEVLPAGKLNHITPTTGGH